MVNRFLLSLVAALAAAPVACAAAPVPNTADVSAPATVYHIATGDELEIAVLNQPDLTRTVAILPEGTIGYPYLGQINAAGLTISELTQRLTAGLSTQLAHPQVTVRVVKRQEKQISVLGPVRNPGQRTMQDGWHVLDVIADCGGLSIDHPEKASAMLVHRNSAAALPIDLIRLLSSGDPEDNLPVAPGDVLLVQATEHVELQVRVLGEVSRPGLVAAPEDGSLRTVLAAAGGPTPRAALSLATILRGSTSIPVDLRDVAGNTRLADAVTIRPGDTLVIPENTLEYTVLGAVHNPGVTTYPDGKAVTVLSALSRAGGQTDAADLKNATLIRRSTGGKAAMVVVDLAEMLKKGDTTRDLAVKPGDILFLPSRRQGGTHLQDILGFLPFVSLFSHF